MAYPPNRNADTGNPRLRPQWHAAHRRTRHDRDKVSVASGTNAGTPPPPHHTERRPPTSIRPRGRAQVMHQIRHAPFQLRRSGRGGRGGRNNARRRYLRGPLSPRAAEVRIAEISMSARQLCARRMRETARLRSSTSGGAIDASLPAATPPGTSTTGPRPARQGTRSHRLEQPPEVWRRRRRSPTRAHSRTGPRRNRK